MSRRRLTGLRLSEKYDAGNRETAEIILADPERYAGLPLEWARLWMERHLTALDQKGRPAPVTERASHSSDRTAEKRGYACGQLNGRG